MADHTDADTIARLAEAAGDDTAPAFTDLPVGDEAGHVIAFLVPDGKALAVLDTEYLAAEPRRARGTVQVYDAPSFATAVRQRADTDDDRLLVSLYADEETPALVAILNDDLADPNGGRTIADWRDHRVELALRRRPEWQHWLNQSGKLLGQEAFAEHIEAGLAEIVSPPAADMLDLAQTFQAQTSGRFRQGSRLADGRRQFVFEEDVDATAGIRGDLTIPETFELAVRPFYGSEKYAVTARFRYRLNRQTGELQLGYVLDRPHEVEAAAFADVRDAVGADLGIEPISGRAPAAVPPTTAPTVALVRNGN